MKRTVNGLLQLFAILVMLLGCTITFWAFSATTLETNTPIIGAVVGGMWLLFGVIYYAYLRLDSRLRDVADLLDSE